MEPKEEPIDDFPALFNNNQILTWDVGEEEMKFKQEVMDDVNVEWNDSEYPLDISPIDQFSFTTKKEEIVDDDVKAEPDKPEHEQVNLFNSNCSIAVNGSSDANDLFDNAEVEKGLRTTRNASKNQKYIDPTEDSDGSIPPMKKSESGSAVKKDTMRRSIKEGNHSEMASKDSRVAKRSDTHMDCPKCDFRTHSATAWISHLRNMHSTTPALSGLVLRCECGHTGFSRTHILKCNFANFTVISVNDAAILSTSEPMSGRRKKKCSKRSDTKMACPKCEFRTDSINSWVTHLRKQHSTTPALASFESYHLITKPPSPPSPSPAGLALRCECGQECLSERHSYSCNLSNFTVIRKSKVCITTPQCVVSECEKYPTTVTGYIEHLHTHHKFTLRSVGIYLMCECGVKFTSFYCKVLADHNKKCNGCNFTVHKFNYSIHPMEPIDVTPVVMDDNQIPSWDFGEEESKFNKAIIDDNPPIDQRLFAAGKEEVLDDDVSSVVRGPIPGDTFSLNDASLRMDVTNKTSMEDGIDKDESMPHVDDNGLMNSDEKPEVERRRLPRRASKNLKYTDPTEDSDNDSSPQMKKSRSDSVDKKDNEDKKRRPFKDQSKSASRVSKRNDTELECPECEYRTVSVRGWVTHLSRQHSTTPKLAGLALRCDCGHESFSDSHNYLCNVANFTVISASDVVTPAKGMDCPECEFRTNSVRYWLVHLRRQHSTTPALAGVALRCECGHESFSENHNNVCKIAKFTVIRKCDMTTPTTPKCLVSECEKYPKTVNGYIAHVQVNHNSTLKSSGFYILCACGVKMTSIGSKVNVEHSKKCNGRDFTIHKPEEE